MTIYPLCHHGDPVRAVGRTPHGVKLIKGRKNAVILSRHNTCNLSPYIHTHFSWYPIYPNDSTSAQNLMPLTNATVCDEYQSETEKWLENS